ncbi:MAG: hypothetical protein JWN39_553 [Ilumatobacteraceae bacterium]|nr:hypothetical protein [Ilumatobacteraceae bacterium]
MSSGVNPAAVLWARSILRRSRVATIFLAVFAGLVGTAVLTSWEYSRRADSVIPRRIEALPLPDGTLQSCPPGVDPGTDPTECFTPTNNLTAFAALKTSPHQVAGRVYASATVAITGAIGGRRTTDAGTLLDEDGILGNGYFISGHAPDPDDPGEASMSEKAAEIVGVRTGDSLEVDACAPGPSGDDVCDDHTTVRVVGITRSESDLVPQLDRPPGVELTVPAFGIMVSRAWYFAHGASTSSFVTTNFKLAPGSTLDDVRVDLARSLSGWAVLLTAYEDSPRFTALRRSTSLQGYSFELVAVILLLAGMLFVGQTILRQIRRELSDRRIVVAMGSGRRLPFVVAAIRFSPIVIGATLISVVGALVLSSSGPTGIAGRAEVQPGFRFDATVVLGGAALSVIALSAMVALATAVTVRERPSAGRRPRAGALSASIGSAALRVGTRRYARGLVIAVIGTTVGIASVATAAIVVGSLARVDADSARYGAPWDYAVATSGDPASVAAGVAAAKADPYLTDLALVTASGPFQLPGVATFWAVSMQPQRGSMGPTVVSGRPPTADDEIAIAPLTMRAMGLHIGDSLTSLPTLLGDGSDGSAPGSVGPFSVVGEVLVGAVDPSVGPGNGVIVTEAVRSRIDTAGSPYLVVRTNPTMSRTEVIDHLVATYGSAVVLPGRQDDLRNLDRVASSPWIVAWLIVALALAAVGHALVTSVRRRRRELAVLRSLGFTSTQVIGSIVWRSVLVALTAVLIGVPLGIVAGRWTWGRVVRDVGLASGAVLPGPWIAAVIAGVLVIIPVLSLWPGVRAARTPLVEALRTE